MRKFRNISFVLAFCLLFTCIAPGAFALDDPNVDAEAVIVADMNSGNILYEKNMNDQRSPASLTKIMTGLLAVEAVENGTVRLDQVITAGEDCRQGLETDSSTANIQPGEQMTFEDLMYCAMVVSANEACNIIAVTVSGSIQNFVNDMNRRARELGCTGTLFSDTNGLTNEDHYTTAYDLFLITNEAMKHPKFVTLVTAKYYVVPATNMYEERELNSSNALMTPDGLYGDGYIYTGAAGVKTGFTKRAGYCLVSTVTKDSMKILTIILGCRGPLANNFQYDYGNFTESIKLYDWTFENFSYRTILSAGQALKEVPVELAEEGASVVLRPDSDVTLLLPNDLSESSIQINTVLDSDPLKAPIEEDQVLGRADVIINGSLYASVQLISFDAVKASGFARIKTALAGFFSADWIKVVIIVLAALLLVYIILRIRYQIVRRKHLKKRMAAAEKRKMQNQAAERQLRQEFRSRDIDTGAQTGAAGTEQKTAIIIDDSRRFETVDPSQRQTEQTDIDALIKSLGLDKYE